MNLKGFHTISVLKHRFKTEDAYRVRKSAHVRICSLMRFRTACGLLKHTHQRWACFKTESVSQISAARAGNDRPDALLTFLIFLLTMKSVHLGTLNDSVERWDGSFVSTGWAMDDMIVKRSVILCPGRLVKSQAQGSTM